jgi:hypothetical protein
MQVDFQRMVSSSTNVWKKSLLLEWIFFSKMFVCLYYTMNTELENWLMNSFHEFAMAGSLLLQAREHINIAGPCWPSDEKWDRNYIYF